jgi:hypothetical protein
VLDNFLGCEGSEVTDVGRSRASTLHSWCLACSGLTLVIIVTLFDTASIRENLVRLAGVGDSDAFGHQVPPAGVVVGQGLTILA